MGRAGHRQHAAAAATRRAQVRDVVTDSRTLQPGDLFVALQGPRFDGHAFAADALARGARRCSLPRDASLEPNRQPARPVGCRTAALRQSSPCRTRCGRCRRWRTRSGRRPARKVVAITGSAGKTTTKEAIAEVLGTRFSVVKNKGNLNNHIGLPLSLMQLRSGPDVAVMELGMNHAGEISTLVAIAEPDVRVWTNVGDAHLGFFASPDAIADAKAEILEGADRRHSPGVQRRRSARDVARCRVSRPRHDVRHRAGATVQAPWRRRPRPRRHARDARHAGRGNLHRHAAARPRQPLQRAGGHRGRARARRAARRDRRRCRNAPSGRAARRGPAFARRHHPGRRLLQLQPGGIGARARSTRERDEGSPPDCRARRDARAWRSYVGAARGQRPHRGGQRSPAAVRRRRRRRAYAGRGRDCRRHAAGCGVATSSRAIARRRRWWPRFVRATSCSSRDRAASARISSPTDSAELG